MSARDIALTAYQAALDAAEAEEKAERERVAAEEQKKNARAQETFVAGTALLSRWFPDVAWTAYDTRSGLGRATGYGHGAEVIVMDNAEVMDSVGYSSKLKLMIVHHPEAGQYSPKTRVYFVSLHTDRDTNYGYWDGPEVKSAADVGRCLLAAEKA